MSRPGRAGSWLVLLVLVSCGDDPTPPVLARFERPNRIDFVCVLGGEPVQLGHCKNDIPGSGLALHALVTQSARGEIAALDLDAQRVVDSRRDIPGFTFLPVGEMPVAVVVPPRHPEVTYVANYGSRDIRALTTAALVTPQSANPTLQILRLALDAGDELIVLEENDERAENADVRVIAPTDMVLSPDENALIVAAPDVGRVIWLPIERCRSGADGCTPGLFVADADSIVAVPLQRSIDQALGSAPAPVTPSVYEELCEFTGGGPPTLAAPPDIPDEAWMVAPRPTALAIDADCPDEGECTPRVLVADESLPVIHALDLAALAAGGDAEDAVLAPLLSGAPTLAVVASPWVPATVTDGGETQYVYAIDASDGSVMVLEGGQVLAVNTGASGRPDRIALQTSAGATALAIATPGFDVTDGAEQWVASNLCTDVRHPTRGDPTRLRGVFLASAHSDGIVRFVDIHDMELKLPGRQDESGRCRDCPATDPPMPALMRHQQRLATNFLTTAENQPVPMTAPRSDPRFVVEGVPFSVRTDGKTGNPEIPGLDCIACDAGLRAAFPPPDADPDDEPVADDDAGVEDGAAFEGCGAGAPALVCGNPDPWSGAAEQWVATYEGLIPDTIGGQGRLILEGSPDSRTGAFEFAAEIDFCGAGVLGTEDIEPSYGGQNCTRDAPTTFLGDQLVLRPVLPHPDLLEGASPRVREDCEALRDALEEDDASPLGFVIRRAYRDRVVLRTSLLHKIQGVADSIDDLLPCLESGVVAFEVRTSEQFTVQGTLSGFQHDVRANDAGRCVVAGDADPLRQGRARPGCTFRNRALEFQPHLQKDNERPPKPETALVVSAAAPAPKLAVNVSSSTFGAVSVVAVQMRYDPISRLLYVVDVHGRGVIPIVLDGVQDFVSGSFN
jgi:hypothetical protein